MMDLLGTSVSLKEMEDHPKPSMAQIRQILTEYCVLPLGSPYIHSKWIDFQTDARIARQDASFEDSVVVRTSQDWQKHAFASYCKFNRGQLL